MSVTKRHQHRMPNKLRPAALASLLVCGTLALGLAAPGAQAATITVAAGSVDANNTTTMGGDGACSLREAVMSINAGMDQGDCVAVVTDAYGTNDTIILPAGTYTLTKDGLDETYTDAAPSDPGTAPVISNVPDETVGDLDIKKSVKIVGAGSATTTIQWDQSVTDPDRIFHVIAPTGTVVVSLQDLKLTKGLTKEVSIKDGLVPTTGPTAQHYYLRRAGGALAVGPAAAVVLIDPNLEGADNANVGGKGGGSTGEAGADYVLNLTNVVVDGNKAGGDGGGIYNSATANVSKLIVSNNRALTNGGGVYSEGVSTYADSTFSGNIAEGGGGIFSTGSKNVTIKGSTFKGNRAIGGGAISNRSGVTIGLVNSTLSGNYGRDVGAGLYTNGSVNLNFVTISRNIAGADSQKAGSGINTFPASTTANTVTLKNVLLEGNKKGLAYDAMDPTTDPTSDSFVPPTPAVIAGYNAANCGTTASGGGIDASSSGHNLSSDTTCQTTVAWLTDTTDKNNVDPRIGDLADNGGPTQTHALLAGSPALGAGIAVAGITTDQRGTTRDATPDIGAYEEPTPVAPAAAGGGGGGCTAAAGRLPLDPTLPLLAALGLAGWCMRRLRQVRRAPINNKKP